MASATRRASVRRSRSSGSDSDARRRSRLPLLARAEQRALTAQAQVLFGQREAVAAGRHRGEALPGQAVLASVLGHRAGSTNSGRSPPDPAPELVQLGHAEAIGALDDHHRGLGHVHPHLDHRGGHQHLDLAGPEPRHDLFPDRRRHLPVQQADRQSGQLAPSADSRSYSSVAERRLDPG